MQLPAAGSECPTGTGCGAEWLTRYRANLALLLRMGEPLGVPGAAICQDRPHRIQRSADGEGRAVKGQRGEMR